MTEFRKWLTNMPAETPIDRAARRALKSRLKAVRHYLGRTKHDDPESVHQLRIWTRRVGAVLRLFEPVMPSRQARKLKRVLRKVRRTAGRVRDCDVILARLGKEAEVEHLRTIVFAERKPARRALQRLRRKLFQGSRFKKQCRRLRRMIAWRGDKRRPTAPPFGEWCRMQLQHLADAFWRAAECDLSQPQALHRLLIAGKRLRYALELSSGALSAVEQREWYEGLADLQSRLGEVCDHLAAVAQLETWRDADRKASQRRQLRALRDAERSQLQRLHRQFLRWWSPARRKRTERRWMTILNST